MQIGMLPLTGTTSQQHMKEDLQAEQLALSRHGVRHNNDYKLDTGERS